MASLDNPQGCGRDAGLMGYRFLGLAVCFSNSTESCAKRGLGVIRRVYPRKRFQVELVRFR